jgi:hypothetical protein
MALAIGSLISFASMMMASMVGEMDALKLHATELLMLLGTAVVMVFETPAKAHAADSIAASETLSLQQPQLLDNR